MFQRAPVVAILLAFVPAAGVAQDDAAVQRTEQQILDSLAAAYPPDDFAAPAPFGPGESMSYRVELGWFDVGEGHMTVEALDTVRGNDTYRAVMEIDAGALGFKLHDVYTTYFDVGTLQSWRFNRDHYGSSGGQRRYEMHPDDGVWERLDVAPDHVDRSGDLGSSIPLDDIGFIYFLRQMDLEVGRSYSLNRYFKEDGNPVVIRVLREETKKVDGGEFECIVVQPIIQTDGLFSEGGKAEIYLSKDDRRLMVYMSVNIPRVPGGIELYLKGYDPGVPLNPTSRMEAEEARGERAEAASADTR